MGSDIAIKAKFIVNDSSLKKAFVGIDKLNKKFSKQTVEVRKLKAEVNRLNKIVATASQKFTTLNAKLKSTSGMAQRAIANSKKLNAGLKQTGIAATGAAKGLGFTGLAFGFVGGMAGMALDRMRNFFETMVSEGGESATKMGKAIILSVDDIGKASGMAKQDAIKLQNAMQGWAGEYPVELNDIFDATSTVARATGDLNSAMSLTPQVLKMMTIEEVNLADSTKALVVGMNNYGKEVGDINHLTNMLITTSLITRANIGDLTKSFGFLAADAKLAGLNAQEAFGLIGTAVQRLGTSAGSSGRNLRIMLNTLGNIRKTGVKLGKYGINVHAAGDPKKMKEMIDIIDDVRKKYNELGGAQSIAASAFLQDLGFGQEGGTVFKMILDTPQEELRAYIDEVKRADQVQQKVAAVSGLFGSQMTLLKNQIGLIQMSFASGLLPALQELTGAFKTLGQDKDFLNAIEQLAKILASTLVPVIKVFAGMLIGFTKAMKDNPVLLYAVAGALIAIAGALALVATVAPILGALFAIKFIVAKYPQHFKLATSAIKKFQNTMGKLSILKRPLDISLMLKGLPGKLLRGGAKGALFFVIGFRMITKALLSAGAWIIGMFGKLAIKFLAGGAAIGAVFSGAFKAASSVILVAAGWLEALFIKLAVAFGIGGMSSGLAFGAGINKGAGTGILSGLLARLLPAGLTTAAFASGLALAGTLIASFGIGLYATTGLLELILPEFMEGQKRKMKTIWNIEGDWAWLALPFWNMYEALAFRVFPSIESGWVNLMIKVTSELNKFIAILNLIPNVKINPFDVPKSVPSTKDAEYEHWKSDNKGGMSLEDWKAKYIPNKNKSEMQNLESVPNNMTIKWNSETLDNQQEAIKQNTILTNNQNNQLSPLIENTGIINNLLGNQSNYLNLSFEMLGKEIIEIARNSNMLSLLTTRIALVDVMWAKLVAEGNKASRRIASLTVSKKGVFSMSGGSISSGDQAEINAAQANYNAVKAGQNIIDIATLTGDIARLNQQAIATSIGSSISNTQKNNINVSPTIIIPQGSSVNVDDLVKKINEQTKKELAKYLGGLG